MRIGMVSPLFESVPPRLYGGTERVVSYLTEELVGRGHEVVLFASGDSHTRAQLVPCCGQSLRLSVEGGAALNSHVVQLEEVMEHARDLDLIHFHSGNVHFPLMRRSPVPHVTTQHGRLDLPSLQPLFRTFADLPQISISDAQRAPLPFARFVATIHHGLPRDLHRARTRHGDYLAFLGRLSPEKGCDRAVAIARATGIPLKVAAKVDPADRAYFDEVLRPLFEGPLVEYLGEIGDREKDEFLGNALALLMPVDWPEPFGLVMIEAMACGTPVVAWNHGAVPEVVDDGVTGFVVSSLDEAIEAVHVLESVSRSAVRARFELRFTVERMVDEHLDLYRRLVEQAEPTSVDDAWMTW